MMTDIDVKQVCKICYGSSSHKPNPTLTPESKAVFDGTSKKCSVCRQGWAPIKVAKDLGPAGGRWVRIRPRPKISANTEFQMCKNMQGIRGECPRSLDCSYAHNRVELALWNAERKLEPRPAPPITGPYQYQLCKNMQTIGSCSYGQRCTFAHSEEEYHEWLRTIHQTVPGQQVVQMPIGGTVLPSAFVPVGSYRCDICSLTCTSRKQLEDHFAGIKHRERIFQMQGGPLPSGSDLTPGPPVSLNQNDLRTVRKRPLLSFQIMGFKMCMHIQANRRCIYGDFCTFAHSNEELQMWNRQLTTPAVAFPHLQSLPPNMMHFHPQTATPQPPVQVPSAMDHQKPDIFAASGLDDFDEGQSQVQEARDFADDIRRQITDEFARKQEIGGFDKSHDYVCVEEVSGQELCLTWTQPDSLQWTFEVSTSAARILHSVVLFDTLATDFTILGAWLVVYGGHPQPLTATAALQGAGIQLRQRIAPPDRVHVKISLKPRSGVLGQLVIFDFGSFRLARGLSIHVLNETEKKLVMNMGQPSRQRPAKPDLYWEQHYTPIAIPGHQQEEVFDKGLPEYPLPEQIEKLIDAGKYNNVENRVTEANYKRRLHNLLYLEEYQQRLDMSRYDLYDIEISPENTLHTGSMGVIYATDGFHYITVSVEEVLFEGGRSIRPGDSSLLLPMNQQVMHECWVEKVGKDRVVLRITEKARQASASSRNRCSLRFVLSRTHMREMHYAVDQLDLASVFPTARVSGVHDTPIPPSISKCLQELKTTKLNQSQQNAINSMLDPACQQIPSLVLGPFGCGKTRTLRECIMILSLLEGTTILICTHSNSAANIYIQELHREYGKRGHDSVSMIRIYYTGRRVETIPSLIRQYCKMENGQLVLPSLSEVKQYRIVVVTLSTSRALSLMGVPKGHFSHIFIDEAAQALESETLIPLILATSSTKIVLAGDHMQMDPPCYSPIARKYGLHVSLLERLFDHEAYNSGVGQLCKTLLTENHRSHAHIMEIPSKLFYKNKLTCRAEFPRNGPHNIPPLKFIGVDGQEAQDEDSPSYYNNHEALKIIEQVKLLVNGGLGQHEICVLSYYQKQVTRIRHLLRNEQLGQVSVFRVDDVQGKEFRALLLSTVRTCYARDDGDLEEDAGFLTNPKLFNTAVTRAKEWLIVCGEPITLCTVGSNRLCWIELIKKCLHQLGSFEYSNASQFERFLETKLVTRKILEKKNAVFFQNIKKVQNPPVIPQTPKQPPPPHNTPTEATATTVSVQQSFAQAQPHMKHQMLKSKVTELAHGNDEVTITKITDELMKLSLQEQVSLLARPEVLQHRVREVESVLRRPGPTAALLSATAVPNPVIGQGTPSYPMGTMGSHKYAPDLPPFLTSIIDGLTNYMKWCDMHLQNPLNNHPGLKDNLTRQRANLGKQMELVNNQITMYRELLKIVRTASTAQNVNVENPAQNPLRGSVAQHVPPRPQAPSGPIHVPDPPQHFPGLPPPAIHHNYHHHHHHHQHHQQLVDHKSHAPTTTSTVTVTPGINLRGSNFPQHSRTSFPTTSDGIHGITNLPPSQQGHMTGHDSPQNRPSQFGSSSAFTYGMPKGAYFPNAQPDEPLAQVLVQTNLTHIKSKGLSPLEAAINDASTRSSPLPFPQDTSDVYLSDDEFNS